MAPGLGAAIHGLAFGKLLFNAGSSPSRLVALTRLWLAPLLEQLLRQEQPVQLLPQGQPARQSAQLLWVCMRLLQE